MAREHASLPKSWAASSSEANPNPNPSPNPNPNPDPTPKPKPKPKPNPNPNQTEWNHDEFGYIKLRRYLPPRVRDVTRYHSLRELKCASSTLPLPTRAHVRC